MDAAIATRFARSPQPTVRSPNLPRRHPGHGRPTHQHPQQHPKGRITLDGRGVGYYLREAQIIGAHNYSAGARAVGILTGLITSWQDTARMVTGESDLTSGIDSGMRPGPNHPTELAYSANEEHNLWDELEQVADDSGLLFEIGPDRVLTAPLFHETPEVVLDRRFFADSTVVQNTSAGNTASVVYAYSGTRVEVVEDATLLAAVGRRAISISLDEEATAAQMRAAAQAVLTEHAPPMLQIGATGTVVVDADPTLILLGSRLPVEVDHGWARWSPMIEVRAVEVEVDEVRCGEHASRTSDRNLRIV